MVRLQFWIYEEYGGPIHSHAAPKPKKLNGYHFGILEDMQLITRV